MDKQATLDLLYVAAFFLGGLGFAAGPVIIALLLAPRTTRNTAGKSGQLIECGMEPIGDAWIRFGIVYYLYALMFVAFAVDILFLFPVALIYRKTAEAAMNIGDMRAFIEILLFVGILSLIIIYAWKKGVFKWERKNFNRQ
ncbi:MAG TPA: NADH-quinone oxidoreductase subunit A [Deltaproteobacteria bacterium]|nr:NADH-quinone oxidoreductase subunit A [Deltaproteobacteria bacterium]HQB39778.1 NADH-quinone oxidoreductase subunit A [Deltaproteobacteria bacterium]